MVKIPLNSLLNFILTFLLVPYFLAYLTRRLLAAALGQIRQLETSASRLALFLILWIAISLNTKGLVWSVHLALIFGMVACLIGLYWLIAWGLGFKWPDLRVSLPLMLIYKNSSFALTVGTRFFPPGVLTPIVAYIIVQNLVIVIMTAKAREEA